MSYWRFDLETTDIVVMEVEADSQEEAEDKLFDGDGTIISDNVMSERILRSYKHEEVTGGTVFKLREVD